MVAANGCRWSTSSRIDPRASRRLGLGGLVDWIPFDGRWLRPVSSGFQAMRPEGVHHLAAEFRTDLTDANVLVRLHRKGFKIQEVPVRMQIREGGRSMHGGLKSLIYAGRTLIAVRSEMQG